MKNNIKTQEISEFLSGSAYHVEMFDSLIADKDATIFNLENELKWLKEQIKLGQQQTFGKSTEKLTNYKFHLSLMKMKVK